MSSDEKYAEPGAPGQASTSVALTRLGRHAPADHPERLSNGLRRRFDSRADHRLAGHLDPPALVPPAAVGLWHHRQRRLPDRGRFAQGRRHPYRAAGGKRQGDDANPGTTPLQSAKLYEAIPGNGGITRLAVLPYEPHWYAARESNEQHVRAVHHDAGRQVVVQGVGMAQCSCGRNGQHGGVWQRKAASDHGTLAVSGRLVTRASCRTVRRGRGRTPAAGMPTPGYGRWNSGCWRLEPAGGCDASHRPRRRACHGTTTS